MTKEVTDYAALLPLTPPDGTISYCIEHTPELRKEYLIYRVENVKEYEPLTDSVATTKVVNAVCTACEGHFIADYITNGCCHQGYSSAPFGFLHPETNEQIISGEHCLCPICGAEVTVKHIGNMPRKGYMDECGWVMTPHRIGDKLALLGWIVRRDIYKDGHSTYRAQPYEGVVFEKKKAVRLCGYNKYMTSYSFLGCWVQRIRYQDIYGKAPYIFGWNKKLLEGSTVQNSKLDRYISACRKANTGCYPTSYLKLYQTHPQVENLIMQGFEHLVIEGIIEHRKTGMYNSYYGYSATEKPSTPQIKQINWKATRPAAMLGLNKTELKLCRDMKLNLEELECYNNLKSMEKTDMLEAVQLIKSEQVYSINALCRSEARGNTSVMRCLRYLQKQREKYPEKKAKINIAFMQDYWRMCAKVDENIDEEAVRLPKNLVREHDRVTALINEKRILEAAERKAKEMAECRPGFAVAAKRLEPYAWQKDGIIIRACQNEDELIKEGAALHHCVASYAWQISSGSTAIFFIRREKEPDKPWYTLELDEKNLKVRQNRGKQNCERTPAVEAFEKAWIEHLSALKVAGKLKIKKKKEKKTA